MARNPLRYWWPELQMVCWHIQAMKAMMERRKIQRGVSQRRLLRLLPVVCFLMLAVGHGTGSPVFAELRTIWASGEHRMGGHDTKEDAIRLAVESAKRNALEQVATYLESITVARGTDLTRDEIHTYTAGLVTVLQQRITTAAEGDDVIVKADLLTRVDTEEVTRAIATLRANEEARSQLAALKRENERLRDELEGANRALAAAATPEDTRSASRHRREILYRVQSNAMVSQAWTDWALIPSEPSTSPVAGMSNLQWLLQTARELYPESFHVIVAEQIMAGRRAPGAVRPPSPSIQGKAEARMPRHEVVPNSRFAEPSRTLNEFIYMVPEKPTHERNDPSVQARPGARFRSEREAGQIDVDGGKGDR